jgi:hypothetical protein
LTGCQQDTPSPSPGPASSSSSTTTVTTTHTTTTPLTCHPGNELDACAQCDYCGKAHDCEILGTIGCDRSQCIWVDDNSTAHGGKCQSPHATTTHTTTPATGCMPHTTTDPCFTRGTYAHSEPGCVALGPIGCQGQVCHFFAMEDGTEACGSRHSTTTEGPCVPETDTDKCFTTCASYCHAEADCLALGAQGCGNVACEWHEGHCRSSSAFWQLV